MEPHYYRPLDVTLAGNLETLVTAHARGDPESLLQWVSVSTRTLARELTKKKHTIGHNTVATLLKENDFSLQSNQKTREGADHPEGKLVSGTIFVFYFKNWTLLQ